MPKSMSVETSGLSAVLSNLIPYTVYNISIKAKNSAGYGPESGLKSNRTKEDGLLLFCLLNVFCKKELTKFSYLFGL